MVDRGRRSGRGPERSFRLVAGAAAACAPRRVWALKQIETQTSFLGTKSKKRKKQGGARSLAATATGGCAACASGGMDRHARQSKRVDALLHKLAAMESPRACTQPMPTGEPAVVGEHCAPPPSTRSKTRCTTSPEAAVSPVLDLRGVHLVAHPSASHAHNNTLKRNPITGDFEPRTSEDERRQRHAGVHSCKRRVMQLTEESVRRQLDEVEESSGDRGEDDAALAARRKLEAKQAADEKRRAALERAAKAPSRTLELATFAMKMDEAYDSLHARGRTGGEGQDTRRSQKELREELKSRRKASRKERQEAADRAKLAFGMSTLEKKDRARSEGGLCARDGGWGRKIAPALVRCACATCTIAIVCPPSPLSLAIECVEALQRSHTHVSAPAPTHPSVVIELTCVSTCVPCHGGRHFSSMTALAYDCSGPRTHTQPRECEGIPQLYPTRTVRGCGQPDTYRTQPRAAPLSITLCRSRFAPATGWGGSSQPRW